MISDGVFGDAEYFEDLVASVNDIPERGNDWFLLANDFASYMDAQVRPALVTDWPLHSTFAQGFAKTR